MVRLAAALLAILSLVVVGTCNHKLASNILLPYAVLRMYYLVTSPLGLFSMADVGFFVSTILAFEVKISGTLVSGPGIALLLIDLLLLYTDVWIMYLSIPVLLAQLARVSIENPSDTRRRGSGRLLYGRKQKSG